MKQITTMAGIIFNEKGEILCSLRDVGKYEYVSLKWEFPGGKVEEGEKPEETLKRELREELDISVEILSEYCVINHDYPDFHLTMTLFKCKLLSQTLKMNVHKSLKWLKPEELLSLDWAAADLPVAQSLFNEYANV